MKKRTYRAVRLNLVDAQRVVEAVGTERIALAIDVAKEDMYAAVMDERRDVHKTVKWKHPWQSGDFVGFASALREAGLMVEVAMEPSGTYGDALRYALLKAGFEVWRVNPKRSKDAAEVYDGVPSSHDAKSAAIIAKLHLDGASEEWPVGTEMERTLKAAVRRAHVFDVQFRNNRNRLEGLLARHWPELPRFLDLGSATLLELLIEFGGPAQVARHSRKAGELMRRVGGVFLAEEKIETVVKSAPSTVGIPMVAEERELVRDIAAEARRNQKAAKKAKKKLEKLTKSDATAAQMGPIVGKATAGVLIATAGKPERYESAGAYLKSLGLNLKEHSSGKKQGKLRITKRGSGYARLVLYMAALRMIQKDLVTRAWYAKKVRQNGGCRIKAVIAVVRKLVKGLWHAVKYGVAFDSRLLFDTSRLRFTADALELP